MTPAQRQALLQSIATTIADYRQGEIASPDSAHVDRWVSQFDASDQPAILEEMDRILKTYYVSRQTAADFVRTLLTSTSIFGANPPAELAHTRFLRIQRKGNSQDELLALVAGLLQSLYGLSLQSCGASPRQYVYLDDCLFSGNTAWHDLHQWLPHAIPQTKLQVVFFAVHTGGLHYLRNNLDPETNARGIVAGYWSIHRFENIPWQTQKYEALWPRPFTGDSYVDSYVQSLQQRCQGKHFSPRVFRSGGVPATETLFSSSAARDVVERAFLKKGAYITSLPANPKPQLRPLGYEKLESLGFGSLLVTYRNAANNTPLVLWWGDPMYSANHPLSKWYPLFPRKINAPAGSAALLQFFGL